MTHTECRFGIHYPYKIDGHDYHMLKLVHTDNNGIQHKELKFIEDYQMPFWVTKEKYRVHKQTKPWEEERKLIKRESTVCDLIETIGRVLRRRSATSLRELYSSPYLYGVNISSTTLLKEVYNRHGNITPYSIAAYDIETDVTTDDNTIILASIAMDKQICCVVNKEWYEKDEDRLLHNVKQRIMKYLGNKITLKDWKFEVILARNEMEVVRKSIGKAHEWKPDFLAVWNVAFDIGELMKCCDRYGVDYKDLFSDPDVPDKFKYFKWYQGQSFKVTTDGTRKPIPFSEQWHYAISSSSFFIIDAMCVYRRLRLAKPLLQGGYGLDNVLHTELGERKLAFTEADRYSGLGWHSFMQREYKDEYIVYNMWDVISMLELENKTKDLSMSLPMFAGYCDFGLFSSSTKVIGAQMYFYLREKEMVPGTPEPSTENDSNLLGLRGWISTLPAYMIENNGIKPFTDYTDLTTNIRGMVFDADAISSYPSDITALNVSRETNRRELIDIDGVPQSVFQYENMNLIMAKSNAPKYCKELFNLPDFLEVEKDF